MQNTRTTGPAIVCVCTLMLGMGGVAFGIMSQLPASAAQTSAQSAQTSAQPPAQISAAEARPAPAPPKDVSKLAVVAQRASN